MVLISMHSFCHSSVLPVCRVIVYGKFKLHTWKLSVFALKTITPTGKYIWLLNTIIVEILLKAKNIIYFIVKSKLITTRLTLINRVKGWRISCFLSCVKTPDFKDQDWLKRSFQNRSGWFKNSDKYFKNKVNEVRTYIVKLAYVFNKD